MRLSLEEQIDTLRNKNMEISFDHAQVELENVEISDNNMAMKENKIKMTSEKQYQKKHHCLKKKDNNIQIKDYNIQVIREKIQIRDDNIIFMGGDKQMKVAEQMIEIALKKTQRLIVKIQQTSVLSIISEDIKQKSMIQVENQLLKSFIEQKLRQGYQINLIQKQISQNKYLYQNNKDYKQNNNNNNNNYKNILQNEGLLGGGNNVSIPNLIQLQENKLNVALEESQKKVEITLIQIYESIIKNKIDCIANPISATQENRINTLKLELLQFIEDNWLRLIDSLIQSRFIFYRFFEDYKDCYFLTLNKKFDNQQELVNRLKQLSSHATVNDNTKPSTDLQYQLNMLSNFEKYKSGKVNENSVKNITQAYQSMYLNYQKHSIERNNKTALLECINQARKYLSEDFKELLKEQDEIVFYLETKFDSIELQVNSNNIQADDLQIGILLQLNENVRMYVTLDQVLSRIVYFLEQERMKTKEEMLIDVDKNNSIINSFVKNLIQVAIVEQDNTSEKQKQTKFMLNLIILHLIFILEEKQQTLNCIFEELKLFSSYYDSLQPLSQKLSVACFKRGNWAHPDYQESLLRLKFKPESLSDVISYFKSLKQQDKEYCLNIPQTNELQLVFSQSIVYVSGKPLTDNPQHSDRIDSNVYQHVINYYKNDSTFKQKVIIIGAQSDSGKTTFIKNLLIEIEKSNKLNNQQQQNKKVKSQKKAKSNDLIQEDGNDLMKETSNDQNQNQKKVNFNNIKQKNNDLKTQKSINEVNEKNNNSEIKKERRNDLKKERSNDVKRDNSSEQNNQIEIFPFYLRSKFINLKNGTFEDILYTEPLNLTIAQKKLLMGEGIKLFILDGINDVQYRSKQILKLLKSINYGKNIHFLITTREENLKQDVFLYQPNFSQYMLQQKYIGDGGINPDFELFSKVEQKKVMNWKSLKINYQLNNCVNIFIIREIREIIKILKNRDRFINIIPNIHNRIDLIAFYIHLQLEKGIYKDSIRKQEQPPSMQEIPQNKNKLPSLRQELPSIRKEASLIKEEEEQEEKNKKQEKANMIELCMSYLECVAFVAHLKEYKREDDDFSVSQDEVEVYLQDVVKQNLSEIVKICLSSGIIFQYTVQTGLLNSQTKYIYFRMSYVFVYFLTSSFARDFQNKSIDFESLSLETLQQFKIAQRPIVRYLVNKQQIDILDMLFYKLFQFKKFTSLNHIEGSLGQNQKKCIQGYNFVINYNDNNQEQEQKNEVGSVERQIMNEGIDELDPIFINFMQKFSNLESKEMQIAASNILSSFFQSNLNFKKVNLSEIQLPFAYINQLQQAVTISPQFSDHLIIRNSANESEKEVKQSEFIKMAELGSTFAPRCIIQFGDEMLFCLSQNQLFKYVYENQRFVINKISDFQQNKFLLNLNKCKDFIYCCDGQNIVYRIEPRKFDYITLKLQENINNQLKNMAVSEDGKFLVTHFYDVIYIWDIQAEECKINLIRQFGQQYQVQCLVFFKNDSNLLAISSQSQSKIFILDIKDGINRLENNQDVVYTQPISAGNIITAIDFYNDLMVIGSRDTKVRIIKINEGYREDEILNLHNDWIRSVVFSSCGRFIMSTSDDSSISIYDREKQKTLFLKGQHSNYVMYAAFLNDNTMAASLAQSEPFINIWDVSQLKNQDNDEYTRDIELSKGRQKDNFVERITQNFYSGNCVSICFENKQNIQFATGSPDGNVYIWKMTNDKQNKSISVQIKHVLQGHLYAVAGVDYSKDNSLLASCSNDRKIIIWNVQDAYSIVNNDTKMEHSDAVSCVSFSPNCTELASGGWDDVVKIWKITKTNQKNYKFELSYTLDHTDAVLCLAYSPSGDYLASGSAGKVIQIWRVNEKYKDWVSCKTTNWVCTLLFTQDSKLLIAGLKDDRIIIYDNNFQEKQSLSCHSKAVSSIATIKKDSVLLSGSLDQVVISQKLDVNVDKVDGQNKIKLTVHNFPINSIATEERINLIITTSKNSIKLHKFNLYQEQLPVVRHEGEITSLCFASNGILASTDCNGILKLWDSDNGFMQIGSFEMNHSGSSKQYSVQFSYNCEFIVTNNSTELKVWNKYLKLIATIAIEEGQKVYISHYCTYLVVYSSQCGPFVYRKSDSFKKAQFVQIKSDQTISFEQLTSLLLKNSNNQVPYIFNMDIPTFFYKIRIAKLITFSEDEKYMFCRFNEYYYSCYDIENEFQQVLPEIEQEDLNKLDIINWDYLSHLTQQEQEEYKDVLISSPMFLYQNNHYVHQKYLSTLAISFDFKYFACGYDQSSIIVFNLHKLLQEEIEQHEIKELEEEKDQVQNENENNHLSESEQNKQCEENILPVLYPNFKKQDDDKVESNKQVNLEDKNKSLDKIDIKNQEQISENFMHENQGNIIKQEGQNEDSINLDKQGDNFSQEGQKEEVIIQEKQGEILNQWNEGENLNEGQLGDLFNEQEEVQQLGNINQEKVIKNEEVIQKDENNNKEDNEIQKNEDKEQELEENVQKEEINKKVIIVKKYKHYYGGFNYEPNYIL